ncbi:cutinase-domain-containing protein [Cercophora newfieldiana]|uniref:cutinase n=1 Tax=Cercophora newfieldiana TaxID=92897 RepID=A0AA39XZZ0_9PEZI|nr:cutinase-domain-containing protein [Cercophora newfieldiana]
MSPTIKPSTSLPTLTRLLLTTIEPLCALNGAIMTFRAPHDYISTYVTRGATGGSPEARALCGQLGGAWLLFAFNEAVVMRACDDLRVWRLLHHVLGENWIFVMKAAALLLTGVVLPAASGITKPASLLRPFPVEDVPPTLEMDVISLNTVLDWITHNFPANILVKDASDLIIHAENVLASVVGVSTTQDTFVDDQCPNVTILYARGTDEVGNVGIVVGPEFFDAVAARLPTGSTIAVRGVNYSASVDGFLEGGDPAGSQEMRDLRADDISHILDVCPLTKLVLAGYSQGGQVLHNTISLLAPTSIENISSTVIFGDPNYPEAVPGVPVSRQLVICHDTDNICAGGDIIYLSHLTYAADVDQAADFVMAHL